MQNKTLIICLVLSKIFVSVFSAAGVQVTCKGDSIASCTSACGTPIVSGGGTCSWNGGQNLSTCQIADCNCINSGTATGLNDAFCKSCIGSSQTSFANAAGTACVATSASCINDDRLDTMWNLNDCILCNPATPALVSQFCAACSSIKSGWTDANCNACATAASPPTKNVYANSAGTSCVAASASCKSTSRGSTAWTAADCAACTPTTPALVSSACASCTGITTWDDGNCNSCATTASPPTKNIYANGAGNSCVAASASCTTANRSGAPWTISDCILCNPNTPALVGSTCTACNSVTSGEWTDANCKACATTASPPTQNVFANGTFSSCVASLYSCNQTSRGSNKWTDRDCALCNGTASNANQYASADGSSCQSTQLSTSSTFSGQIFVSTLLVLSSLLI
ncbi:cell surface immobilization antigen (macronuclear) [Tetrahymena thermophila SB210]|uniref:Cell surface immobilization antigen n=1 Tax=Tetrahymena thermophila (strain SB210) TaxID=312017 RepID=Q22YK2_TETTS|nr:cell surface immobilization antigen [Tetrahymena thermophila SB210]EAR90283.1 cell surface immobilization antigen [Tetrahymena thermophila SB210]|eukprot:XP_001010528.1 cell surface immobilization antigen [Tetrahymena thermophila SB210]